MTPVNFLNPVASTATAVATKLYGDVNRRSAELSTGFADASIDIARTQISSNLTSSAKVQRAIYQSLQSAIGMLNTALNELTSAREQVDRMRAIIVQAKNANPETLAGLDSMYRKTLQNMQSRFSAATYNGRLLFDGTLKQDVRIGEDNTNIMNISLIDLREDTINVRHAEEVNAITHGFGPTIDQGAFGGQAQSWGVQKLGNSYSYPGLRPIQNVVTALNAAGGLNAGDLMVAFPLPNAPLIQFPRIANNANSMAIALYDAARAAYEIAAPGASAAGVLPGGNAPLVDVPMAPAIGAVMKTNTVNSTVAVFVTAIKGAIGAVPNPVTDSARSLYDNLANCYNQIVKFGHAGDKGFIAGIGCDTGPNQATDSSRALASAGINPRWVLVRDTSDTLNGVATAGSIVGSIQNTLQATKIENNGVATAGTLILQNTLNSTADENQAVAEAIVKALGKMLDKAIIDTRTQLKIAESSAQSLTDSIKVAQETADDLGRADIPTTMANLVNDIKALQAAIFAQSLGNKIPEALLELLRSS